MVSQLPLTNLELSPVSNVSGLWADSGLLGVGPELFENEDLELGMLEKILQQSGKSVKSIVFHQTSIDLFPEEAKSSVLVQKFVRLVKIYCPNVEHVIPTSLGIEDYLFPFEDYAPALFNYFRYNCVRFNGM